MAVLLPPKLVFTVKLLSKNCIIKYTGWLYYQPHFSFRHELFLLLQIMRDPETGNSRGFGFVSYDSFEASDSAIEVLYLLLKQSDCWLVLA